ncbi:hypothetical protein Ciccas_006783 [Cichlidogyrus casuarinus]|uniref:Immunoglobulin domain-containing protein n=1 Tax=Cichlidogyrus casuarinus TaxID=1844966 RepID=A0ABD2Q598_9PLAT
MLLKLLVLILLIWNFGSCCDPTSQQPEIMSPTLQTVFVGFNAIFVCCGGSTWTYKSKEDSIEREISFHPSGPILDKKEKYTVYSMNDDKNRLVLNIMDAKISDAGLYYCQSSDKKAEAQLIVNERAGEASKADKTVTPHAQAQIVKSYQAFPKSDINTKNLILKCPKSAGEKVILWKWRAKIRSESTLDPSYSGPFQETLIQNKKGVHETKLIEVLDESLDQVRILNAMSPRTPRVLWCQIETSQSHEVLQSVYFVEIHWDLYESLKLKIEKVEPTENDKMYLDSTYVNAASEQLSKMLVPSSSQSLVEHQAAKLACQFKIDDHNKMSIGNITWYRNGNPVPQPPFHVDNSQMQGIGLGASFMWIRSYALSAEAARHSANDKLSPEENFTCIVPITLNKPDFDPLVITQSTSFIASVVKVPRILNRNLVIEKAEGDSASFESIVVANGEISHVVQWSKNDNNLYLWKNISGKGQGYDVSFVRTGTTMEYRLRIYIAALTQSHHSAIRILVSNEAGLDTVQGRILVNSEPKITISTPTQGYWVPLKPFIVSCLITGHPLSGEVYTDDSSAPIQNLATPVSLNLIHYPNGNRQEMPSSSKTNLTRIGYQSLPFTGFVSH